MDRRLQQRYVQLVKAHMSSSSRVAAGPTLLPGKAQATAATQAVWRFLNNERVGLAALAEPLRHAGREACRQSPSDFVLLVHDWCKIDYKGHTSKKDLRQITHQDDIGYDMTTALLVDAQDGAPLAPMQMHLRTADCVHSTAAEPVHEDWHHLDQLEPTMREAGGWGLDRTVVHVIDREADSLGDFRDWDQAGYRFLVRCDERRVLWNDQPWLISEIANYFDKEVLFEDIGEALHHGKAVRQEVAEAKIILHRPHKTRVNGKQHDVAGRPLPLRLIITRLIDEQGYIVAQWTLLCNVGENEVSAQWIAYWYYWRWRIESFFKLLKSHGQELEHWQQESGEAIARRMLVAAMACVVVWALQRDESPEAAETKAILVRLSGRSMKRGRAVTAPALLAGFMVLLSLNDLLNHTDFDLKQLQSIASKGLPFINSS
jgi:hypothetical protein